MVNFRFNLAVCLIVAIILALAMGAWFGWSLWRVFAIAFTLACLIALAYAGWLARRVLRSLNEPVPSTHGVTMSWAAPFYDTYCPWLGLGPRFRHETLQHAAVTVGERVLDVGCGTGVLTRLAAEVVGSTGYVVGIDPSPGMIVMARRNATMALSHAEFRLAAIEQLPFADAAFDIVLSSFMLHHLPPEVKRSGLREVFRVLKPGGRLLAVDIDRPSQPLWWLLCWPLLFFHFTGSNLRGEVPAYLRAAGFMPVKGLARKARLLTFWRADKPLI